MKTYNEDALVIESSQNFKQAEFKIEASGIAFQILSQGIYADPVAAVIRELSTNAFDSHVDAGHKLKPFDVTLPTQMNPIFKIRDYGIGLSEEDMFNLYTTYFGSNKRDSDEKVGCLGLGSKSPFAVANSFMVASWFNGRKTIYSIHKNEKFPTINKMHEIVSDEPNGLEISINIPTHMQSNWLERAKNIYYFFETKPNFLGSNVPIFPNIEYEFETNDYKIRKRYQNQIRNGVIEGNICYPINLQALNGHVSSEVYSFIEAWQSRLELYFPIGSTRSTASREELEYNSHTIKSIENAIEHIINDLKKQYRKKINEFESYLEALIYVKEKSGYAGYEEVPIFTALLNDNLKWKKRKIENSSLIGINASHQLTQKVRLTTIIGAQVSQKIYKNPKTDVNFYRSNGDFMKFVPAKEDVVKEDNLIRIINRNYAFDIEHWIIALNDIGATKREISGYIKLINSKNYPRIIVCEKTPAGLEFLKNVQEAFGTDEVIKFSSFKEKPVIIQAIKSNDFYFKIFVPKERKNSYYDKNYAHQLIKDRSNKTIDTDIQYYIKTCNGSFNFENIFEKYNKKKNITFNVEDTNKILLTLIEIGILNKDAKVAIIAPSKEEKFKKLLPNLKHITHLLDNVKFSTLSDIGKARIKAVAIERLNKIKTLEYNKNVLNFISVLSQTQNLDKDFFIWLAERANFYNDVVLMIDNYSKIYNYYDKNKTYFVELNNFTDNLSKKYVKDIENSLNKKDQIEKEIIENFPICNCVSTYDKILIDRYIMDDWSKIKGKI